MAPPVGTARSMSLRGLESSTVLVEAVLLGGLPHMSIVGLADTAVTEARERLRASFSHVGIAWPNERLTVNLSPADTAKTGTRFDLAIAAAIVGALGYRTFSKNTAIVGELGLDGSVRPVRGVLPSVLAAQRLGYSRVLVPARNAAEARLISGLQVVPVEHLAQVAALLGVPGADSVIMRLNTRGAADRSGAIDGSDTADGSGTVRTSSIRANCAVSDGLRAVDFDEVYGQQDAIWALEVAAVGEHHVQLVGAPGIGKSMLAERFPGILPELNEAEAVEVAAIQSLMGLPVAELPRQRPFAAPHHTATTAAIVGGGSGIPQPGAITYAHHGVLFCDEFPEFSARAIQALRQPMETGWVDLHRAHAHVRYPAQFQLIAAANPCRCGKAFDGDGTCVCKPYERIAYRSHLGGPIRDRFDIRLVLRRPSAADIATGGSVSTAHARAAVLAARERAHYRSAHIAESDCGEASYRVCNARLPGSWLREHTPVSTALSAVFDRQLSTGQLSLRGLDRVRRLAWSVADLHGHDQPNDDDFAAAFTLRGEEDIYGT
ncbi:MAG: ATP-binding protein [Arcanobacterium sp.]|nr:ATP-binding protein [Arcanobacterium sp.]